MTTTVGPIDIPLTSSGISEVLKSFKNVESRLVEMERKMTEASTKGARSRVTEAEKEAKRKQGIINTSAVMAGRLAKQQADQEIKENQRAAKAVESEAKRKQSIIDNSARMAGRLAAQQADKEIAEAKRSADARERMSKQLSGRIVNDFRSTLGHVTSIFGTILGLGGGISVAQSFSREMAISKASQNASLVTDVPGKPVERISAKELSAQARVLAKKYNVHEEDVLAGQQELMTRSSAGRSVLGVSEELLKLSKAENTKDDPEFYSKLSGAYGKMLKQGVDPNMGMTMMRAMVGQGRAEGGAVEFSEAAPYMAQLASKANLFGGSQEGNVMTMAALFQSAAKVTKDPESAAIAVNRFTDDIVKDHNKKNGGKLRHLLGHDTFENGKIMSPLELIPEIFAKAGGNVAKLEDSGLGIRSNQLLNSYLDTYQKAENNQKGSGANAVRASMNAEVGASISAADVDRHLTERGQTDAEKAEKTWNDFDREIREKLIPTVSSELIPALAKTIPLFGELLTGFSKLISWVTANPFTAAFAGLGAILAKSVAMEVAASGLKNVLGGILGGSGASSGGGAGKLNPIAGVLTAGAVGVGIGEFLTHNIEDMSHDKQVRENEENVQTNDLFFALKAGKPGAVAAARAEVKRLRGRNTNEAMAARLKDKTESDLMRGNNFEFIKDLGSSPLSQYDNMASKNADVLEKALEDPSAKLAEAADKLSEAADKMNGAATSTYNGDNTATFTNNSGPRSVHGAGHQNR